MTAPLMLGVVVGYIVDRARSKKSVALFATVLKAATPPPFLPIILYGLSSVSITLMLLAALLYGLSIDLLVPVRAIWGQSFLRRKKYPKGWSVANIVSRTSRLSGYLFSGMLIAYGLADASYIVSILFLVSLVPIIFIEVVEIEGRSDGLKNGILEGFRYLRKSGLIMGIVVITAISGLFLGMTDSASTVIVGQVLHLDPSFLSYTFFSISAGGISGSVFSSTLKSVDRVGMKLAFMFLLYAAAFYVVGIQLGIYVLIAALFFAGFLSGLRSPIITSMLLGNTERSKMETVQGAMDTIGTSFNSISAIVAGLFMSLTFPGNVF